jgi:PAS domain-containing protein
VIGKIAARSDPRRAPALRLGRGSGLVGRDRRPARGPAARRRGLERCFRWEARPWRNATGEIVGVITYMDDITALADARREARVNARRLRGALGAARAGVYEIDHEQRTFWGSPEFHRMMGRRIVYEDVREAVWPMVHPDDRELYEAAANGAAATGQALEIDRARHQRLWRRTLDANLPRGPARHGRPRPARPSA